MQHINTQRQTVYRFCLRCWKFSNNCSCITLFSNPFLESNCLVELEEVEALPNYTSEEESQPGSDLDVIAPLCQKSHQHDEFIPVHDFGMSALPEPLRHTSFYVWLRNCFPLVVRIIGTKKATGRACLIPQEILEQRQCVNVHCPYRATLGPTHDVYGGIGIITNKHVVQNDEEAKATTVEFFYDDEDNRRWTVYKEQGFSVYMTNHKMDYTTFTCYTHKQDLLVMIATFDKIRNYAWMKIPKQIRENSKSYAIIISHPHGSAKKVSVGSVVERQNLVKSDEEMANVRTLRDIYNICEQNNILDRFAAYLQQLPDINLSFTITWYTTATCQGSSGAPVFMGDVVKENRKEINQAHTHRGVDKNMGYNNCFT